MMIKKAMFVLVAWINLEINKMKNRDNNGRWLIFWI